METIKLEKCGTVMKGEHLSMTTIKKFTALILGAVMLLTMSTTAFATEENFYVAMPEDDVVTATNKEDAINLNYTLINVINMAALPNNPDTQFYTTDSNYTHFYFTFTFNGVNGAEFNFSYFTTGGTERYVYMWETLSDEIKGENNAKETPVYSTQGTYRFVLQNIVTSDGVQRGMTCLVRVYAAK